MPKRVQRTATAVIIAVLLLLFTLPGAYLSRVCDEMRTSIADAEAAVVSGGDPTAALLRLSRQYEKYNVTLKLFLDHVSVDAVGAAIAACTPLGEPDALISALRTVGAAIAHLLHIEAFQAANLL